VIPLRHSGLRPDQSSSYYPSSVQQTYIRTYLFATNRTSVGMHVYYYWLYSTTNTSMAVCMMLWN